MSAIGVLIITIMAAGYGLWMRHGFVQEIKEQRRRCEVREQRNKHRKRR